MRYSFEPPPGWIRAPFPPPQRGIYLRAPIPTPSAESASILLFEAVTPAGSLEAQLGALVQQACEGAKSSKVGKVAPVRTRSFPALGVPATLQVPTDGRAREEQRFFALVDTVTERLPVIFVGGAKSLPFHQKTLDALIGSIGHLLLEASFYMRWVE
jgi:hypothetical protein